MLFNRDVIFIHVPKTGGMSVTHYLLETLPPPIYYFHPTVDGDTSDRGIVQVHGLRHETLAEAESIVREYGYDLHEVPLVLAVLRNPYALEVSRYAYLRKGNPWDRGTNQQLAMNEDFETFAIESHDHGGTSRPLESYFLLNGQFPRNLHIAKLENLAEDLSEALRKVGIEKRADLTQVNISRHDRFESYYTRSAELAVYQRYKWVFDHGFYERIDPRKFVFAEGGSPYSYELPLEGPVHQVGPAYGLRQEDSWSEGKLTFRAVVEQPVSKITIEGVLPRTGESKVEFFLTIDERRAMSCFESGKSFTWDVPCSIRPGIPVQMRLTASTSRYSGNPESEQESFSLHRITFQPDSLAKLAHEVVPPESAIAIVDEGGKLRKVEEQQGWCLVPNANGDLEKLFMQGTEGVADAPWIWPNSIYEFRLYAGNEYTTRLATVQVTHSDEAFVRAHPNPVPAEVGPGKTTISWSTGEEGSWGQVYVAVDGGPEKLLVGGSEGAKEVSWIWPNKTYEFRLYAGKEHEVLLGSVKVERVSGEAFIMASPNPVPAGVGPGKTAITWSTGEEGSWGQVYVRQMRTDAYYPADDEEAIAHLESLRAKGAEFLLFPATAFWWLEHYEGFRRHLKSRYRVVADRKDVCLIFDLRAPETTVIKE